MSKRIQMSAEERGELVLRLLRKEATAVELAQEASISEPTLYQWRDAFLRAGYAGLNGRSDRAFSDRLTYRIMREFGLLQKRAPRRAELHQTRHLFELLPTRPNELWQMDVTYVHLPQGHWWYVVTVIDYYSRYLLACHLTPFQSAVSVGVALDRARAEAERLHGPLDREPTLVTDNGSCFLARKFQKRLEGRFSHVRIQYRTPQQLGLLERFHATLKKEEVYWRLYEGPNHARQCLVLVTT